MKLSKNKEKELMQVYEAYWAEYLNGNVDAMQALLDDSYTQIGSAAGEVFASKKEAVQFLVDTIDQVAGKLEMRNRNTKLELQDHLILIHEVCDLYALADKKWIFYSKFRASTLLQEKKEGWKITHQHSSFPDTKTEEGQNVAIEKIAEENKELREAVKRRTVELEHKNRELQIEAALERVRAKTMAMHQSHELNDVASVMYKEMESLGLAKWGISIIISHEDTTQFEFWLAEETHTSTSRNFYVKGKEHPVYRKLWKFWKDQGTSLTLHHQDTYKRKFDEYWLNETDFRHLPDEVKASVLDKQEVFLHYASMRYGMLNATTYEKISNELLGVLARFAKVFEQTYTRFLDLQKAETQAKEAQIETALERVRSRSMAMHKSEELKAVVKVIFYQMAHLKINAEHAGIVVDFEPKKDFHFWVADNQDIPAKITVPYLDLVWDRQFTEAKKKGTNFFTTQLDFEEKNSFYKKLLPHIEGLTKQAQDFYLNCPGLAASTVLQKDIGLYIENFSGIPFSNEENSILMRFGKVFQQSYTRFLDLQKAEAQAREAQIETALERVRSRSMAMHKSEELAGLSLELVKQVQALGVATWFCAFNIYDEDQSGSLEWGSNGEGTFPKYRTPREGIFLRYYKAGQKGETLLINEISENECASHYDYLCSLPGVGEQLLKMKDSGISFPTSQIDHVAFFKYGYILFITYEPVPDAHDIFKRFAKVFQQTYTRFLDLQKAEAQAREAQIEAALEKVRTASMTMQKGEELAEVISVVFTQLKALGIDSEGCGLNLYDKEEGMDMWMSGFGEDLHPKSFHISFFDHPYYEVQLNDWKNKEKYRVLAFEGNLKRSFDQQTFSNKDFFELPKDIKETFLAKEKVISSVAYMKYGMLEMIGDEALSESQGEILCRFAKVFEQAYTRFLDIQQAEVQAREAQIEAALERVRSKTMAMHNSADVGATVVSLSDEVLKLGLDTSIRVGIGILEGYDGMETWSATPTPNGKVDLKMGMLDMTIHPMLIGLKKAWKSGKSCYSYDYIGDDVFRYYQALNNEPDYPFQADLDALPENEYHKSFFYNEGILFSFAPNPISEEAAKVLARFAGVFGQTYRRYLDLQRAETQAREAEIEATLEKVRSRTMAMHKSEELAETALVLYEQFSVLGNIPDRMSIGIFKEETKEIELWPTDQFGSQLNQRFRGFWKQSAVWTNLYKAWKAGNDSFVADLSGQKLKTWLKFIREELKLFVDDSHIKGRRVQQAAFFSQGFLLFTTNEPVAEEIMQLLVRFAKVFSQTYTRFLDLQKAEAQAREAQIETSLEKVRSRTMAMQNSFELPEAANDLFLQVQALGIPAWSAGYCIWETKDQKAASCNMSSEGEIQKSFILPTIGEGYNFYDPLQKGETFYVEELGGDALVKHYDFMRTLPTVGQLLDKLIAAGLSLPTFQIFHIVYFPQGYLMFITYEQVPDAHEIFKRFAKVFEQTYTRFLDLQKAEAQAREATKQASLDRVRGQIASMRTAADLERITPLVWNELTTMEVPFIRCGVFIMHEPKEIVEVYLSAPDGHSLGVLHLQFNADPLTANTVAHWRKGTIFKEHWNKEEFLSWTKSLMEQGQISNIKTYQGAANPPESLNLHFIPFTQGMLYVGSENPLNVEQIELVQSLADAFAIAYARYEDFTKLEKAKESVETTLSDLKTTQNQLIQSEKMASLGELTAGIAHEIQNPLNFVNNFSEVSSELIEEMNEEIEKGEIKEAKAIANDVKQNLEKILHHGKRADGIVKGMLQHSRSSSGVKEPSDINALADEYLRLAYHGLRAKDKSFNATMETDFDENIGNINIIPQDIGRVLLNLITNAFYACTERKSSYANASEDKYEPTVSVSTKKIGEKVLISVKDNGNGIPKKVLDKIFQPFFTTKPTGQGTGLGLSLSYDIIKAHKGEISVKSKVGEGTAFTIALPVNAQLN